MSNKFLVVILASIFILSSCTQAAFTQLPTATNASSLATTTFGPSATLKQDSGFFAGPGNDDFDILRSLTNGSVVFPKGIYGDFVQATVSIAGENVTGFIWKEALDSLPDNLPVLTAEQVPWDLLFVPQCSPGVYVSAQDTVTFSNAGKNYYDTESGAIPLTEPLKIKMASAQVTGGNGGAIKILGIPEQTTGNWWQGITRMDVGTKSGNYSISIWDGRNEYATFVINLDLPTSRGIQIIFDQPQGKSFHMLDETGNEIQSVDLATRTDVNLPNGLFPNGVVYIGTTLTPQTSLAVKGLQIGQVPSGTWSEAQNGYTSHPGLAELATQRNLTIGTDFKNDNTSDPRYCRIMKRDFNLAVLSDFSSPDLWLGPGQYDFSALDRAVDKATQQGWRIRASHLIWGAPESLPTWLKTSNYSRDQYIQIMEQYIRDIVGRYKGRVQEWSIANEATIRSWTPGMDFWNDKIGPEYITLAFQTARQADPNGVLIFNDVNNQSSQDTGSSGVVNKMYTTVKQLKAQGVPIDVVGMQMHLLQPWETSVPPQKADVIATMQKFASLGVRIYITEFDVDLAQLPGTKEEKLKTGTKIFSDMMEACLESGVCDSFSTWGIADSLPSQKKPDLMFDVSFNPKPDYFAVENALLTDIPTAATATPGK